MPQNFLYTGLETSLGLFGTVRSGDVLRLTVKEHPGRGDKLFKPLKDLPKELFAPLPAVDPNGSRERALADEQGRRDKIQQVNDSSEQRELEQMTKDELLAVAEKSGAKVFKHEARQNILLAILNARPATA